MPPRRKMLGRIIFILLQLENFACAGKRQGFRLQVISQLCTRSSETQFFAGIFSIVQWEIVNLLSQRWQRKCFLDHCLGLQSWHWICRSGHPLSLWGQPPRRVTNPAWCPTTSTESAFVPSLILSWMLIVRSCSSKSSYLLEVPKVQFYPKDKSHGVKVRSRSLLPESGWDCIRVYFSSKVERATNVWQKWIFYILILREVKGETTLRRAPQKPPPSKMRSPDQTAPEPEASRPLLDWPPMMTSSNLSHRRVSFAVFIESTVWVWRSFCKQPEIWTLQLYHSCL